MIRTNSLIATANRPSTITATTEPMRSLFWCSVRSTPGGAGPQSPEEDIVLGRGLSLRWEVQVKGPAKETAQLKRGTIVDESGLQITKVWIRSRRDTKKRG